MAVRRLQALSHCFIAELIVQEGSPCRATDSAVSRLLWALDHGTWGEESMFLLHRVAEFYPHRLTRRIVEALLPENATMLYLVKCPLLTGACINSFIARCPNLKELNLAENPHLDYSEIHLFQGSQTHPVHGKLTHVCLHNCQVSDEHVHALLRNVPSLRTLNIFQCNITDKVFLLNETKQVAREGGFQHSSLKSGYDCQLELVNVTSCSNFSSIGVRHLCTLCGPTLKWIHMGRTKVDCTSLLYLCGLGLPAAAQFYMSLEEAATDLILGSACGNNIRGELVEALAKFEERASQIREEDVQPALYPITVSDKHSESDREHGVESTHAHSLAPFFSPKIECLSLSGKIFLGARASHRCLRQFLLANSEFNSLNLKEGRNWDRVTDKILAQVTETSTELVHVTLEDCKSLTPAGVAGLVACKKLKMLDLKGISSVKNADLVHLVRSLCLNHLFIAKTAIENSGLVSIASLPSTCQLQQLDLSRCWHLEDDQGLNAMVSSCHELKTLTLAKCPFSNRTVELIASNCQKLTRLTLQCCGEDEELRDDSVILLSRNLPLLEFIDLSENPNLTDASVHALLRNCHRLKDLHLMSPNRITAAPFTVMIAVPEELTEFIAAKRVEWDSTNISNLGLSDLPCLPRRSAVYATQLEYVNVFDSEHVQDEVLETIEAITMGSVKISNDEEVSIKEGLVEKFIKNLLLNTSELV